MKSYSKWIVIIMSITLVYTVFSCAKPTQEKKDKIQYLLNDHWNKGNSEYQLYKMTIPWYGKPRQSKDSMMVIVKEGWDSKKNVKTDNKQNMDSATLKFSTYDQFKTGTYNYSFKADIFFNIPSGEVVKYAMGSQDGCGNHFFIYQKKGSHGLFKWYSYWNDHGEITMTKPVNSFDTFYDALPVYLRFNLNKKSYKAKVVQSLVANHPLIPDIKGFPKISEAQITNEPSNEKIYDRDVIKTTVVYGGKPSVYYFDKNFPHSLVKLESPVKKDLYFSKLFDYWNPKKRGKEAGYLLKDDGADTKKDQPKKDEHPKKADQNKKANNKNKR